MNRFDDAQTIRLVEDGYWRVRMDTGELARNRIQFLIDDAEYAFCEEIVTEILAKVPNHDLLPDVSRVRSTHLVWRRYAINHEGRLLRIIFEPKMELNRWTKRRSPVLIWQMVLRKNLRDRDPDWIYGLVGERQQYLYPEKHRDRKGRLVKEKGHV